jgi:putative transposase
MVVAKASFFRGQVFAVGGIGDHVHLVVSVPPSMALSDFVARVKGSSSHSINHELKLPYRFEWQAEYGVVSFGAKQLDLVTDYVRNQRSRHASRQLHQLMERAWHEGSDESKPEGVRSHSPGVHPRAERDGTVHPRAERDGTVHPRAQREDVDSPGVEPRAGEERGGNEAQDDATARRGSVD